MLRIFSPCRGPRCSWRCCNTCRPPAFIQNSCRLSEKTRESSDDPGFFEAALSRVSEIGLVGEPQCSFNALAAFVGRFFGVFWLLPSKIFSMPMADFARFHLEQRCTQQMSPSLKGLGSILPLGIRRVLGRCYVMRE